MFLIDNNLSYKLAPSLRSLFPGILHVAEVSLDEEDDLPIWKYAAHHNLHILTKDADFNDIQNLNGYPPKIVWIRSGNVSTEYIENLLKSQAQAIIDFLNDPDMGILEIQ